MVCVVIGVTMSLLYLVELNYNLKVNVDKNIYKVNKADNNRLSEMGFIKGTIFRIVKKVSGMLQLRFNSSDVVIREETKEDIEVEEYVK